MSSDPNCILFSKAEEMTSDTPWNGPKPNVIFILADDMGFGDLGFFGNPDVKTPVLDEMAKDSICMTQHYTAAPVCAPARAALLTGKYPYRTGQDMSRIWRGISPKMKTIANYFDEAGYATGLVGKWHLNGKPDKWVTPENMPWSMGFNECVMCPPFSDYWNWTLEYNGTQKKSDGRYLTDVFTDEAISFIDRHSQENFFLYLSFNAPHFPLQAREEDLSLFSDNKSLTNGAAVTYAMIHRMDYGIGRVIDTLKKKGLYDNTIIVFTSDNGPFLGTWDGMDQNRFNGFMKGAKGFILDGGIRVPAMIRWPEGLPAHKHSCSELIHMTDWLPTLLGAAGIDYDKDDIDGVNMLPVLRGQSNLTPKKRFWSWNHNRPSINANSAMRDGCWKLYRPFITELSGYTTKPFDPDEVIPAPLPPQLFRLDVDPYEQNDLAASYPDKVKNMCSEMNTWFEKIMEDFYKAIEW